MKTTQRPSCKHSSMPLRTCSPTVFLSLLCFALLICVPSAPVQAGLWDVVEDLGKEVIRQGTDAIRGTDEPEPSHEPAPSQSPPGTVSAPPPQEQSQPLALPPAYNYDRQKVAKVQDLLNRLGYDAGTVDGLYGHSTRKAIQAYEADRGLPARGDVTAALLARLAQEAPPAAVTTAPPPPAPQEQIQPPYSAPSYNSDRQRVARVQALLNRLGYDAGTVDGFYGSSTRKAIRAYQAVRGVPLRGDVTDELIARLAQEATPAAVATEPAARAGSAGTATQSSGQDAAGANQHSTSRATPDFAAAAPGARPAEGCSPVDTAPDGSTVIAGTAPPEGVLCYRLATGPGQSVSVEVTEGRNVIVTVPAVVDAVDRTEFTATSRSHDILVGQLMRSVTNEPFRIRIVTAPAGAKRAAAAANTGDAAARFGLATALDRPIVTSEYDHVLDAGKYAALRRFFDFVNLGLKAEMLRGAVQSNPGVEQIKQCLARTYLPEAAAEAVVGESSWHGASQFEKHRSAEAFAREHLPGLVAAAPKLPLGLVEVSMVTLGKYDFARRGFHIMGGVPRDHLAFPGGPCFRQPLEHLPFTTVLPSFLPIEPGPAEELTMRLEGGSQGISGLVRHRAFAAITFRLSQSTAVSAVGAPAVAPLMVEIESFALYEDAGLTRLIHTFAIDGPAPPVLLSGTPDKVPPPGRVLDETTLVLLLIGHHGDVLDGNAWKSMARRQGGADRAYYLAVRQEGSDGRFEPGYRPFFPYGQINQNRDMGARAMAAFKDWTMARAAALPSRMVLRGRYRFDQNEKRYRLLFGSDDTGGAGGVLLSRGYVAGQVVRPEIDAPSAGISGDGVQRIPLLVLANLAERYRPEMTAAEAARFDRSHNDYPVEIGIEIGRSELLPVADGREAFVIHVTPVALRVMTHDARTLLLERTFDVAALDPTRMVSTADPQQPAPEKLALSAETMDLLVIRHLPDSLTEASLRRMLLARWDYETSFNESAEEPQWGRFFVEGKPKPDEAQQRELLPQFRKWTLARASHLPEVITATFDVSQLKPGPLDLAAWSSYHRHRALQGLHGKVVTCRGRASVMVNAEPGLAKTLENVCAFLEQAGTIPERTLRLGGQVYRDLDNTILVLDKEIVVPADHPEVSWASVELDIRITNLQRTSALPLTMIEKAEAAAYEFVKASGGLHWQGSLALGKSTDDLPAPVLIVSAAVTGARLIDKRSGRVVADLPLQEPQQLQIGLLQKVAPKAAPVPSEPFGPDIVGLRLGMSFEEADRLIRSHMKVGRVLEADRAWQSTAVVGEIEPFTSGRLYESEDGSDLIILFDEPPAAPGVVLGIVRQVVFPKATVPPAAIDRLLREKYGAPLDQNMRSDLQLWAQPGEWSRHCVPSFNAITDLGLWRRPDGTPAGWNPETMRYRGKAPGFDIFSTDTGRTANCPTGLSATFDQQQNADWDRLVLRLFDYRVYGEQFRASVRAPAPYTSSSESTALPDLDL